MISVISNHPKILIDLTSILEAKQMKPAHTSVRGLAKDADIHVGDASSASETLPKGVGGKAGLCGHMKNGS